MKRAILTLLMTLLAITNAYCKVTYLHSNPLGSIVAATDETGKQLWVKRYTPFGIESEANGAVNDKGANHGFATHEVDKETGLVYMKARYYDPEVGRFYSTDPISFQESTPISFNAFVYGANNPNTYIDPNGKIIQFAIVAGIAYGIFEFGSTAYDIYDFGSTVFDPNSSALDIGLSGVGLAAGVLFPGPGAGYRESAEGFTRLWRAVEADELADIYRFGDYNIHPNSTYKRFGLSEQSLDDFIGANPDRSYWKTYVDVPNYELSRMDYLPDPGGAGNYYGIDVFENPDFYGSMGKVNILDSGW